MFPRPFNSPPSFQSRSLSSTLLFSTPVPPLFNAEMSETSTSFSVLFPGPCMWTELMGVLWART